MKAADGLKSLIITNSLYVLHEAILLHQHGKYTEKYFTACFQNVVRVPVVVCQPPFTGMRPRKKKNLKYEKG
jgi:hypothetical protein